MSASICSILLRSNRDAFGICTNAPRELNKNRKGIGRSTYPLLSYSPLAFRIVRISSIDKKKRTSQKLVLDGSGRRTRTSDLRVMSPTSCQLLHPAIYRNYIVISLVCGCKGKQNFRFSKILVVILPFLYNYRAKTLGIGHKKGCRDIVSNSLLSDYFTRNQSIVRPRRPLLSSEPRTCRMSPSTSIEQ